jgi:hypothetical protein
MYLASWPYNKENIYQFNYGPSVLMKNKTVAVKSIRFSNLNLDSSATMKVKFIINVKWPQFCGLVYDVPENEWTVDLSGDYSGGNKKIILQKLVQAANDSLQGFINKVKLYLGVVFDRIDPPRPAGDKEAFVNKAASLFYGLYFYITENGMRYQCNLPAHFDVYTGLNVRNYINLTLEIDEYSYKYISGAQYSDISEITMRYDYLSQQNPTILNLYQAIVGLSAANSLRVYGNNVSALWVSNGLTFVIQETSIDIWPIYQNIDKIIVMSDFSLTDSSVILIGDKYSEVNILDSFVPDRLINDIYIYKPNPTYKKKIESLKSSFTLKFYKYNGKELNEVFFSSVDIELI